jgi:serine protease AprX
MGKIVRRKRWLLAAGALGVALTFAVLIPQREETSPTVVPSVPRLAQVAAAAPEPTAHVATTESKAPSAPAGVRQNYIVQAATVSLAHDAVTRAGGVITGELGIIRAVGAELDSSELAKLQEKPVDRLRIYDDAAVTSSSTTPPPETYYPTQVGAATMHTGGVTGRGVTVAVLDTGVWEEKGPLQQSSSGRNPRVIAQYDVILARENPSAYPLLSLNKYSRDIDDPNGHGTHVSSIIASSAIASTGRYQGVAPGVNLDHRQQRHCIDGPLSGRCARCESRFGARSQQRRHGSLLRRHCRHSMGRESTARVRHPRAESFIERAGSIALLG